MGTDTRKMEFDTRVIQKDKLYLLLRVKKDYLSAGYKILPFLADAISFAKAAMDAEDVAYVEKQIAQRGRD